MSRLVACGSRNDAYQSFRTALRNAGKTGGAYPILRVDREAPVIELPWEHLRSRDQWERPFGAEDEQAQLMVQRMESWIMTDRVTLRRVFGDALRLSALQPQRGIDGRHKDDVRDKLVQATRGCERGRRYEKGRPLLPGSRRIGPSRVK